MKDNDIVIRMKECQMADLSDEDRMLVNEAKAATRNSYAPYSRFHVGAAILLGNGEVVKGANQENAAFSAGTCAERSACFYASANYPGVPMRKIAVAAWVDKYKKYGMGHIDLPDDVYESGFQSLPISPCGVCRQALLEYEHLYGDMEVLLYGRDKIYKLPSIKSLIPLSFTEF